MKKILALSLFVAFIASCTTTNQIKGKTLTLKGTVEKIEMSTFQYGKYLLKTGAKDYALRTTGTSINFDDYLKKVITVKGKKVPGYPIDGGPELIDVTLVKTEPAN